MVRSRTICRRSGTGKRVWVPVEHVYGLEILVVAVAVVLLESTAVSVTVLTVAVGVRPPPKRRDGVHRNLHLRNPLLCQQTQGRSSRKVLEILSTLGASTLSAGLHPTGNTGRAVHVPTVCGSQVHLLLQKCQAYCTLILVLSFFTHGNCDRFGIHDC